MSSTPAVVINTQVTASKENCPLIFILLKLNKQPSYVIQFLNLLLLYTVVSWQQYMYCHNIPTMVSWQQYMYSHNIPFRLHGQQLPCYSHVYERGLYSPDHGKLSHCHPTSTSKHMEHWGKCSWKVKTWIFLNKESEPMRCAPSQTGWLITIGFMQHVYRVWVRSKSPDTFRSET